MATRPEDVAEIKFYRLEDVMRITGFKRGKAYRIIREINQRLEAKGLLVLEGRIEATEFARNFREVL